MIKILHIPANSTRDPIKSEWFTELDKLLSEGYRVVNVSVISILSEVYERWTLHKETDAPQPATDANRFPGRLIERYKGFNIHMWNGRHFVIDSAGDAQCSQTLLSDVRSWCDARAATDDDTLSKIASIVKPYIHLYPDFAEDDFGELPDLSLPVTMTLNDFCKASIGQLQHHRFWYGGLQIAYVKSAYDDMDWFIYFTDGTSCAARHNTRIDVSKTSFLQTIHTAPYGVNLMWRYVARLTEDTPENTTDAEQAMFKGDYYEVIVNPDGDGFNVVNVQTGSTWQTGVPIEQANITAMAQNSKHLRQPEVGDANLYEWTIDNILVAPDGRTVNMNTVGGELVLHPKDSIKLERILNAETEALRKRIAELEAELNDKTAEVHLGWAKVANLKAAINNALNKLNHARDAQFDEKYAAADGSMKTAQVYLTSVIPPEERD